MYDNPTDLANRFALFFVNKISDIHNNITGTPPRSSEGCKMCNTVHENDWNLSLKLSAKIISNAL